MNTAPRALPGEALGSLSVSERYVSDISLSSGWMCEGGRPLVTDQSCTQVQLHVHARHLDAKPRRDRHSSQPLFQDETASCDDSIKVRVRYNIRAAKPHLPRLSSRFSLFDILTRLTCTVSTSTPPAFAASAPPGEMAAFSDLILIRGRPTPTRPTADKPLSPCASHGRRTGVNLWPESGCRPHPALRYMYPESTTTQWEYPVVTPEPDDMDTMAWMEGLY